MKLEHKFSEEDLQRIKSAVKHAEDKISGEIVPVIVERSATYETAIYKFGIISAAIFFVIMIMVDRFIARGAGNILYYDPVFIFFVVVAGGALGTLIPIFSARFRRMLVSKAEMDECTRQRAENVFLEEEVFDTRHRTGIMIFISFFEHEVIVMADRGISKVVEQNEWDKIVSDLVMHIRKRKVIEGMEAAIKRCGEILLEKGFNKTSDDINELRDDLRIS